ncbi:hypothetical protein [Streptomyces sp. NPDC053541]|uniref:hypothetical protein n=1 Tax=Streptomyces sp. NPDC053541 TaxID=3365709 RepID=UPI0037D0DC22
MYVPDRLYTAFEVTESPESGDNIPVVISWWYHPDPADPSAQAGAVPFRNFIRAMRLHEHMAHHLVERSSGQRAYLSLTGTRAQMHHHPLTEALAEADEFPFPDPFPADLGHALVRADVGMYVLIAHPLAAPPTFATLSGLVNADPSGVGMGRFELRADEAARLHYADAPWGPSEELLDRLEREPDASLREGLRFAFGLPRPGERHL